MDATDVEAVLARGELSIEGRLVDASNATLYCTATLDDVQLECVYKPRRGERPLWDFPPGTLGDREVAAYIVSESLGWDIVPLTVWRDTGPVGPGMCQLWITTDDSPDLVDIVPRGRVPAGWRDVIDATGADGSPVSLVHADTEALRGMAVFDALVNNADRKGGHVLVSREGDVFGVDHGVCFNEDDKLRTVLWGWAGEPLDDWILEALDRSCREFEAVAEPLARHLSIREIRRTRERLDLLLAQRSFPYPGDGWPALPWPAF